MKKFFYKLKQDLASLFKYPSYNLGENISVDYDVYWQKKRGDKKAILSSWQKERADYILKMIEKGSKVLDLGGGDGAVLKYLKDKADIDGTVVDVSEEILDKAKDIGVETIQMDISNLELLDSLPEVDYIMGLEIIEHLPNSEEFIAKIKSKARKSLIFSFPNTGYYIHRLRFLMGRFPLQWITSPGEHLRFWTVRDVKWWVRALKFDLDKLIIYQGLPLLNKIFPKLFGKGIMIKITPRKKVIYTAIFGDKDRIIEPKYISKGFDLVCFTDGNFTSDVWQIKKVKPTSDDPVRTAKIYKILPHKYLAEYDYSIWVDGNMMIVGDGNKLIEDNLKESDVAFFSHNHNKSDKRNCVYQEAEVLINMAREGRPKDDPELIKKQIEKYKNEGYPKDNGLIVGMVIARRHNSEDVVRSMEDWWQEIKQNSRRDQLSFNYIAWKNKLKFKYIAGDSRDNEFCRHTPHLKKR